MQQQQQQQQQAQRGYSPLLKRPSYTGGGAFGQQQQLQQQQQHPNDGGMMSPHDASSYPASPAPSRKWGDGHAEFLFSTPAGKYAPEYVCYNRPLPAGPGGQNIPAEQSATGAILLKKANKTEIFNDYLL